MPTPPKSAQVAIAVFYDRNCNDVLHNALVIIHDDYFLMRPQDRTMFYVLKNSRGRWFIKPYTYKTARASGLVFIGLVHIGSTNKNTKLLESRLVGSLAAQPGSDLDNLGAWAIDAAFDHVLPTPDSEMNKGSVDNDVDEYRDYFEYEVASMKERCGGTFESVIPHFYTVCDDSELLP